MCVCVCVCVCSYICLKFIYNSSSSAGVLQDWPTVGVLPHTYNRTISLVQIFLYHTNAHTRTHTI